MVLSHVVKSDAEISTVVLDELRLQMALEPSTLELGVRSYPVIRQRYAAGEVMLCPRREEVRSRMIDASFLVVTVSDAALMAASGQTKEVELRCSERLQDPRIRALLLAVNAERVAGFPAGQLFLDSVEQALAVSLVRGHAVESSPMRSLGGLTTRRLRRVVDFIQAKLDDDLSLEDIAGAAEMSVTHFARVFRQSTGETPYQFLLRQRVRRAAKMLHQPGARILDVALACGFKSQQHFAKVFRRILGATPTEYRQEHSHLARRNIAQENVARRNATASALVGRQEITPA